jgi:CheY-like chemotaxis protein
MRPAGVRARLWTFLQSWRRNDGTSSAHIDQQLAAQCLRCGATATRWLGRASSTVDWFACAHCQHVWSRGHEFPLNTEDPVPPLARTQLMIVDDDASVLRLLQRLLAEYHPVTAQGAAEALVILEHCHPELLITDFLMPNMTGAELLARAREQQPELKALILTGHGASLGHESWWTGERHLDKPCSPAQLRAVVAELIGTPSQVQVA